MFLLGLLLLAASGLNEDIPAPAENTTTPESDHNFAHPTWTGVIITCAIGCICIFGVVMPMCIKEQPDDYLYDPSRPLLANNNVV